MPTPVANLVSGILVTLVVFMDTEIRVGDGGGGDKILLHCGCPPPVVRVIEPAYHQGHRSHSVPM